MIKSHAITAGASVPQLSETSRRFSIRTVVWLLGIALLMLTPLLLVAIVPTQDGPFHLAQAYWIAQVGWHGELPAYAARFLEWNPRLDPTLGVYPVLAGLMQMGLEPLLAYKLVMALFGAGWLLATLAAAKGSRQPLLLVLLCAPLAYGSFFHAGYLNYVFGLLGFFAFVAVRRASSDQSAALRLGLLAVMALGLAMCHLVALVAALLFLAAEHMARLLTTPAGPSKTALRQTAGECLAQALALAPAVAVILSFVLATHGLRPVTEAPPAGWPVGLKTLLTAGHLYAFMRVELLWAACCALCLLVMSAFAWRHRAEPWSPRALQWAIFTLLALAVVLLEVRNSQGTSLSERMVPLVWAGWAFTLVERLPASATGAWLRARTVVLALAWIGLAGQFLTRTEAYLAWASPQQVVWDAGLAHPHHVFVNAVMGRNAAEGPPSWHVEPLLHGSQLAAVAAQGIGLSSPTASRLVWGYSPLVYKQDSDWFATWPNWETRPLAGPAIETYRERHQAEPEVLLISGEAKAAAELLGARKLVNCETTRSVHRCRLH